MLLLLRKIQTSSHSIYSSRLKASLIDKAAGIIKIIFSKLIFYFPIL